MELSMSAQEPLESPKLTRWRVWPSRPTTWQRALKLLRHPFVGGGDLIEGVRDLALNPEIVAAHARGKIAGPHGLKRLQQILGGIDFTVLPDAAGFRAGARRRTDISHGIPLHGAGGPNLTGLGPPGSSIRRAANNVIK
jgi:hypothetical protein